MGCSCRSPLPCCTGRSYRRSGSADLGLMLPSLSSFSSKQVFQGHTPLLYCDGRWDPNISMLAELITYSKTPRDCCLSEVSHILKYFQNKPARDSFITTFFFFFSALKPFLIRPLEQIFHRIIWLFVAKEHNGEVGIYSLSTCNLYIFVLRCFFPSQFFHVCQLAMVIVQEHFFRRGISESGYFCTWHLQKRPSLLGALHNACLKSIFKFSVSLRMMGQVILIHLPL